MRHPLIALIGDYSAGVTAHRAIPRALEMAMTVTHHEVAWRWVHTGKIRQAASDLADCAAVWAVPATPYANMNGALDAIRWARETGRPFLGTCGGFQHAVIEFARNVADLPDANHAETDPEADLLVITRLSCSLVEKTGSVRFTPESRMRAAYGRDEASEGYHCNYGLNPAHRLAFEAAGMRFTAFDEADEIRAFELPEHQFFMGTLFQPERAALRGEAAPVVNALVRALG
jgi:CTP synthase (UTP-ammonia lyase)